MTDRPRMFGNGSTDSVAPETAESVSLPRRFRRRLGLASLAAVALAAGSLFVAGAAPAAAAPGSPGVPQPGTVIYTEDFSNIDATAAPVPIGSYVGGSAADNETYTADPAWSPGAGNCNGWVMRAGTPLPTGSGGTAGDDNCARNGAFTVLGHMAVAMGLYQGMTPAEAQSNQILTQYTNSVSGTQPAGTQLQTVDNNIPTIAGHYYAVSGIFAATNCFTNQPQQEFAILVNGVPTVVGSNLDPCTDPSAETFTVGGDNFSVAKLQSGAIQVPSTGTAPTLGIRVRNLQATGVGNDGGFDLPELVDVTPQLDKSFSPTVIGRGGTSTLTFTITNTTDLGAKTGWSFTDALPANVVLASSPNPATTCLNPAGTGPGAAISAPPGGTSVGAIGSLAQGMGSCTVSVQVTSTTVGSYVNEPGSVTVTGLTPPGPAPLQVIPTVNLSITKTADQITYLPGHPIIYTVTVQNAGPSTATDATVSDDLPTTVTDATWTCAATGGATCAASGSGDISDSVTIPAGGVLTYTVTGTVALTTPNASIIDNAATVIPPAGTSDPNCPPAPGGGCDSTVTVNVASHPALTLTKTADASAVAKPANIGDGITYSFTATNAGDIELTGVSITDQLHGLSQLTYTWPGTPGTLEPGQVVTATATYQVTQVDIIAGHVTNSATATGTPPNGPPVSTPPVAAPVPLTSHAGLSLTKTADTSAVTQPAQVGQSITYRFTATNTGDLPLTSVTITDQLPGLSALSYAWPGTPGTLLPGQVVTATATYQVTGADIVAGHVTNSAIATGTPPSGTPLNTPPASVTVPLTTAPPPPPSVEAVAPATAPLARTGSDITPALAIGGILTLLGVGGILGRRRRGRRA